MEKKFIDRKKDAETKIHSILKEFKEDTGVFISYVDFSEKKKAGFNNKDEDYETKIMIKND